MQIVTDSGTDTAMHPAFAPNMGIEIVPLQVALAGETYKEGVNIEPGRFYDLLASTGQLPTTSQPSAGEFASVYRAAAAKDPDILSIHISAALSGTYNSAVAGAQMVPEARVTHFNTNTLSVAAGWQVIAAAKAVRAGWPVDRILAMMKRIGDATQSIYTLKELHYLIHGGRISHMKGLIASALNIKPLIGVDNETGKYAQRGQVRTFNRAVEGLVDLMKKAHAPGTELRVQVMYSFNSEAGAMLRELVSKVYRCNWLPMGPMSLVLGAHTGPSMVGVAFAPESVFADVPA